MGIYFNPGNENFRVKKTKNYIDKTGMISIVNKTLHQEHKLSCICRPRRFGKTYSTAMLVAYYDKSCDSSELFDDLKIADDPDYRTYMNKYNVMYLDMTYFRSQCKSQENLIDYTEKELIGELIKMYPDSVTSNMSVAKAMETVVKKDGSQFIAVIDEWDAPLRDSGATPETKHNYLEFLRGFFKNAIITDKVFAGAYITGILPVKKDGSQSAISEFREYTMLKPGDFAPFIGFTDEEVKIICDKRNMDHIKSQTWKYVWNMKIIFVR